MTAVSYDPRIYTLRGVDAYTRATLVPSESSQKDVMDTIYQYIKRGNLEKGGELHRIAYEFIDAGAEAVICECTEVSLVLYDGDLSMPVVDSKQVLAEKTVNLASA